MGIFASILLSLVHAFLGEFLKALLWKWQANKVSDQFAKFVQSLVETAEKHYREPGSGELKDKYVHINANLYAKQLGLSLKTSVIDSLIAASLAVIEKKAGLVVSVQAK